METAPFIGIVIQAFGALLLGVMAWGARSVYKGVKSMIEKQDHLDQCVDNLQIKVDASWLDVQREVNRIREDMSGKIDAIRADVDAKAQEYLIIREELAYLKARLNVPLREEIR